MDDEDGWYKRERESQGSISMSMRRRRSEWVESGNMQQASASVLQSQAFMPFKVDGASLDSAEDAQSTTYNTFFHI